MRANRRVVGKRLSYLLPRRGCKRGSVRARRRRGSVTGVEIEALSKRFGSVVAIDHATLGAADGTLLTILGPSGSGKTTVLRCIAGVETPDEGVIRIGSKTVFDSAERTDVPPEGRGIGMVFQSYALWPHMTVKQNIEYPLKLRKDRGMEEKVGRVTSLMKIQTLMSRHPGEISGGEQQRVALARAMVYDPAVVLLDEPFSNLDVPLRESLRDELKELQRRLKMTMICVTHERVDALTLSDEIVVISAGRVAAAGSPQSLLRSPPNSYTASFLAGMLVIDCDAEPAGKGLSAVETAYGRFTLRYEGAVRGKSKVCVPPDGLSLVREASTGSVPGTVSGVVRRPSGHMGVRVATELGTVEVSAAGWAGEAPPPGEKVFLKVDPSSCRLVES